MLEIEKYKSENNFRIICIKTQDGYFKISFEDNFDLYWTFIPNKPILDSELSYNLVVTKENYYLYKLFEDLFNEIKNDKFYDNKEYKDAEGNYKLFIDNKINWHSDDFEYDKASSFTISKCEDEFNITFKRSTGKCFPTFAVRIGNRVSRYSPFNVLFMNMYKKLNEYNPNCHQTHIEEFICKQKK